MRRGEVVTPPDLIDRYICRPFCTIGNYRVERDHSRYATARRANNWRGSSAG